MGDAPNTARGRRISFSAEPSAVAVTRAVPSEEDLSRAVAGLQVGAGEGSGAGSSGAPEMPQSLFAKLESFFNKIDVDGDGTVTLDEAIAFWGKNFAKVNATAMFREVDSDGDGSITFDEWLSFWSNVLTHGYEADDLEEEVEMLLEGNSWVDFNDGRSTGT